MYNPNDPLMRVLLIGALISIPFKVVGIWRAARNGQKGWFAAMILINSLGILELTYLFYFSKPKKTSRPD